MALPNAEGEELSAQELLDAQAHIWNHVFSYVNSMSLKCAVELGIPDAIHKHGKPMTLPELASALLIKKSKFVGLYQLMRILVHSKFFVKVNISMEEEAYILTRVSHLLLKDGRPTSMATFVVAPLDPGFLDPWHHMSEWFRDETSSSPFVTKHGRTLWEYAGAEPEFSRLFYDAMASDSKIVTSVLVKECKQVFEGLRSLVDVAGGMGDSAKAIADTFSGLKCVVLDLPHVVGSLEGSENLSFVSGDMFESIPSADAVFLKWILHDWGDEDCVKILTKCKEAIIPSKGNGGKVIIVDMVVDDEREDHQKTETQLFWDMEVMVELAGKERTEKEWANIFFAAGFGNYKITPVLGLRSVIEVFP